MTEWNDDVWKNKDKHIINKTIQMTTHYGIRANE